MLIPLVASAALLYHALRTYPRDAAMADRYREQHPARVPHVPGG
jgi:hypothetical protein